MQQAGQTANGRYLGDLIVLLDRDRNISDSAERAKLEIALTVLRDRAFRGGANERTVALIRAVQVVLALRAMPVGSALMQ